MAVNVLLTFRRFPTSVVQDCLAWWTGPGVVPLAGALDEFEVLERTSVASGVGIAGGDPVNGPMPSSCIAGSPIGFCGEPWKTPPSMLRASTPGWTGKVGCRSPPWS